MNGRDKYESDITIITFFKNLSLKNTFDFEQQIPRTLLRSLTFEQKIHEYTWFKKMCICVFGNMFMLYMCICECFIYFICVFVNI